MCSHVILCADCQCCMYVQWATCFTFIDTNDWVFTHPAIWDHLYHTVQWNIREALSCKYLIYSDFSKQLPSTVMSSNARGSSISSLQATQSSSMESLESSMSTTESTIGVRPCAYMCVSVCTYVCLCPSCMPVLECSWVADSRGFWDRGRGELQRMGDDIFASLSHFPSISCNMKPMLFWSLFVNWHILKQHLHLDCQQTVTPPLKNFCLAPCDFFSHLSPEVDSARLATVLQANAVLKSELEILRLKCKNLIEENRRLRQASVDIVSPMM